MSRQFAFVPVLLLLGLGCSRSTSTAEQPSVASVASAASVASVAAEPSPAPSSSGPKKYGIRGTDDEFARPRPANDNPTTVRLSQILIAFKGAEHAAPSVTRSREEARDLAGQVGLHARVGEPFEDLVKKYSDDPSAATNHGDLGKLTRDQLPKPLSDAAFRLFKLEVEPEPVETLAGFHLLKRTE